MKPQHQTMGVPSPLPRNASVGTSYSCPQLEAHTTNPQLEAHTTDPQLEAHTTNPQLEAHTTNPEILYERLDKIINK